MEEELQRLISNFYRSDFREYEYDKIKAICENEETLSVLDLAALRCLILAVQENVQKLDKDSHKKTSFLTRLKRKVDGS